MDELKRIDPRALIQLKACRDRLTAQQYKTLRGQVLAGESNGALRGLRNVLNRQVKECEIVGKENRIDRC